MSLFTLAISCLTTSNLIHGPNIPDPYIILSFTAQDFTYITSHIHKWALFSLWLRLFILSEAISPLISSSILGIYRPGQFLFQCPTILPFNTVEAWNDGLAPSWESSTTMLYVITLLFNFYAEYIMGNARLEETQTGTKIARKNINNLRYADDTTLMAESQ